MIERCPGGTGLFGDRGYANRSLIRPWRCFEPEAIAAMGEAFDTACEARRCAGQPEVVRELIAKRIIASASKCELDPVRLQAAALSGLPLTKMSPAA